MFGLFGSEYDSYRDVQIVNFGRSLLQQPVNAYLQQQEIFISESILVN